MLTPPVEYLISHGRTGGVGRFAAPQPLPLQRGDRVVIESARGLEIGVVLCAATESHSRLLSTVAVGRLVRPVGQDEETAEARLRQLSQRLFADARQLAHTLDLPLEILDVELLFDGRSAVLQYVQWADADLGTLRDRLEQAYALGVRFESLNEAAAATEEEEGGCGQPGCGRASGGGCSSCGSGGCSSCGKVELRDYFAHLRTEMEQHTRTPLL